MQNLLFDQFRSIWPSRHRGWMQALLGVLALLLVLYVPLPEGLDISWSYRLVGGAVCSLALILAIRISGRLPTIPQGKIGVVLAIEADGLDLKKRVRRDFVDAVSQVLNNVEGLNFWVQLLDDHHAQAIASDTGRAQEILSLTGATFMIFGDAAERMDRGKAHYTFRLRSLVKHRETTQDRRKMLADEMGFLIPHRMRISKENELTGFEVTSLLLAEGLKYIGACVALISHDFRAAKQLLEPMYLAQKDLMRHGNIKAIHKLANLVPLRLAEAYDLEVQDHHTRWQDSRDIVDMRKACDVAESLSKVSGDLLPNALMHAMLDFLEKSNAASAAGILKRPKLHKTHPDNPRWRFSLAFLAAYEDKTDEAMDLYSQAFPQEGSITMIMDLEDFIVWQLVRTPERAGLYFCLGAINEHGKRDSASALDHYRNFVQRMTGNARTLRSLMHAREFIASQDGNDHWVDANSLTTDAVLDH